MPVNKTEMKPYIIVELERHGIISRAAAKHGVSRQTVVRWMADDKVFGEKAREAIARGQS